EPLSYRYRFGSAEFDEVRAELRLQGLPVEVQQKPLQLLALLLARPGEVVRKEEIYRQLWGDRVSSDNVMANAVLKLRTALGPENGERIVTVARQGYRFDGPVERLASGRRLVSRLQLAAGAPVPGRENFVLAQQLGPSHLNETWRARQPRSGETRVYKFALDGERLATLKREATVYRLLRESLGERPDLARVLDWNFEAPPFFLECEDGGESLAGWADSGGLAALDGAARLALALQVMDAVAAAHGVGVLHKDLKPGNVLIAPAEGGWQTRLTDFGSAGLLEPERLQALQITALGMTVSAEAGSSSLSGTPYYLAPELHTGASFSVRSDLFSLGVLLYQLLCGDLHRIMAPGWERDLADPLLAADIARATDVDPARRFASVAEFALQLRRLPQRRLDAAAQQAAQVEAEQARQQLARARTRRPWVLASVALLVAGLLAALWLYQGQRRARLDLARQLTLVQALNGVLTDDLIAAANPSLAGRSTVTVVEALSAAASGVAQRFAQAEPDVRAGLHLALQQAFSSLSRFPESLAQGEQALSALAQAGQAEGERAAESRLTMAVDLVALGRRDEARAMLKRLADEGGDHKLSPLAQARWLWARAWVSTGELALKESLALLGQARQQMQAVPSPLAPAAELLRDRVDFDIGQTLMMLGDYGGGETRLRTLLAQQVARHGAGHPRPLYTQVALAACLGYQLKSDEAKALLADAIQGLTRTLGADDRKTLTARSQLAAVHFRLGEFRLAASQWAPVRAGYTTLTGPTSSDVVTVESNIGMAHLYAGDAALAEPPLRSALAHARATAGDEAPRVQQIRFALADCLLDQGRLAEVPALLQGLQPEALNLAQQAVDWPARLAWLDARLLAAQGRHDAARQALALAAAGLDHEDSSFRYNSAAVQTLRARLQ
ncbi:MAG TPA: winged helix-turn-helix domain-containing protein, partial [Ideonella sp.]|nr:winged helix-turn-helix domain-containing protein [Ideonella sp.]